MAPHPLNPGNVYQLVKLLASNARPSALRNQSFIVNEVSPSVHTIADENMLATVLSRLLYSLVNQAENSCIRISANEYDDIIFVQLKSIRGFNDHAIDTDLQQAQAYAKKMNGNIGLTKEAGKVTGIVFSFPNMDFSKNAGTQNKTAAISNLY